MLKEKVDKNGFKRLVGTTPAGKALFCRVFEPDYQFDERGDYSATILLSKDNPEVAELERQFEALMAEAEAMAQENAAKNKNPRKRNELPPRKDENHGDWFDKNGEPTGEYAIRAKAKASGTSKQGKDWTFSPFVCDAQGVPFPEEPKRLIGNGSTIKLAVTAFPYASPIGYGISIRLDALQVLDLVEYNKRDAKTYGFGEEEEGYSVASADEHDETAQFADEDKYEGTTAQPVSYRERASQETGDF